MRVIIYLANLFTLHRNKYLQIPMDIKTVLDLVHIFIYYIYITYL